MRYANYYPKGWDEDRARRLLAHYANQTEDGATYDEVTETLIGVPVELVPAVRELIAKHKH